MILDKVKKLCRACQLKKHISVVVTLPNTCSQIPCFTITDISNAGPQCLFYFQKRNTLPV